MEDRRYFIYENGMIKETSEAEYDAWISLGEHLKYQLEDYSIVIGGNQYSIETLYQGSLDKTEWDIPLPFVLFYFEDIYEITEDGIHADTDNNPVEYFATFEELKKRREELIQMIESKIAS